MLARSLLSSLTRSTRSPLSVLHRRARAIRTTALVRAPATAHVLKPREFAQAPAPVDDVEDSQPQTDRSHFSKLRFADAPISENSKSAIRHEYLTDVQEATLQLGLNGVDLLVQAKTGTGKTTAFLLPAIERLARGPTPAQGNISILVLSPTRELAMQIHKEALSLLTNHPLFVQTVIGGASMGEQKRMLAKRRCDILVATPGRLLDLLETTNLSDQLGNLQTLVLDEADRLLDEGFMRSLTSMFKFLPDRKEKPRQCMLYSATLSKDIKEIAKLYLTPDHQFVSTLREDEVNTHQHVSQSSVIAPMDDILKATLKVLQDDVAEHGNSSKAMVFCTTAKGTSATAQLLKNAGYGSLPQVFEIHSRMTQGQRTYVANKFKAARSAILVTSDVTARGMDFPGVTHVVQVGLPSSSEQYIHRLGRTARAGKAGKGTIILTPAESAFLRTREMSSIPIQPHPTIDLSSLPEINLTDAIDQNLVIQAYNSWLGFNVSFMKLLRLSRSEFVDEANRYARGVLGWANKEVGPPVSRATALAVGLQGVKGLNTNTEEFSQSRRSNSEGGGEFGMRRRSFNHDRRSGWGARAEGGEDRGSFRPRRSDDGQGRDQRREGSEEGGAFRPRRRDDGQGWSQRREGNEEGSAFRPRRRDDAQGWTGRGPRREGNEDGGSFRVRRQNDGQGWSGDRPRREDGERSRPSSGQHWMGRGRRE
ncbi:hypothetical protein HYDPIDRAFT_138942 [Hydnomerulius pinastri MD-312]|uniref:ATP-dependent RNA helicase n=1 Tax=Hydnomerulius pinastri MD-312 TaxID=994086 RepID=A0A0C9WBC5_9AGAM|nr:hypothetical protein HYDPIDRAFT_138942 [Hydnomerulius pinastri MD-312]